MKKVKHTLDTLPPLTEAQDGNLKRLATMPDEEINYDDIPKLTEAQLSGMQCGAFIGPSKSRSQLAWMPMCWHGSSRRARATNPA